MIDLRTGVFTDLLPEHLRGTEAKALAYAVGRQVERLLALADIVPFYAMLSTAPENVLDHLAVELRAPAYREAFPLETKRALIRDALLAYAKMGTPGVVDRTLTSIFGAGEIKEWFDYGGQPHHFRAVIPVEKSVALETLEEFHRVLGSVKRLSSWLDEVITVIAFPSGTLHMGGAPGSIARIGIPAAADTTLFRSSLHTGGVFGAREAFPVPEDPSPPSATTILRMGGVCTIISNLSRGE